MLMWRAWPGPGLGLALLQSPPYRQGADRTLALWGGPGPVPLNTGIRLLAFLLGARPACAGRLGGGSVRRPGLSPNFLPWLLGRGGDKSTSACCGVVMLRDPSGPLSPATSRPTGHCQEEPLQRPCPRENDSSRGQGSQRTDRVPWGTGHPPLGFNPVSQP